MEQQKIVAFNNLLLDFFKFITKTFPDEKCLGEYQSQIKTIININPLLIYQTFGDYVSPHIQKINDCDEKFIINELGKSKSQLGEYFLFFNNIWFVPQNTIEVKARIFQYLKKLVKLSK